MDRNKTNLLQVKLLAGFNCKPDMSLVYRVKRAAQYSYWLHKQIMLCILRLWFETSD